MRSFLDDAVHGLRVMAKSPGFTLAAVLTLALGMGANTAVFSILDTVVLQPLPYHEPERVAFVCAGTSSASSGASRHRWPTSSTCGPGASALEEVGAYLYWSANLSGGDRPERVQGYRVTGNTFALLGVDPLLGRTLGPEDARPGAPPIAVISHALWARRFGADPQWSDATCRSTASRSRSSASCPADSSSRSSTSRAICGPASARSAPA